MSTTVTYSAYLKRKFMQSEFLLEQIEKDHALFENIKKRSDFAGKSENIPVLYARPQGLAGDARSTAQTNESSVEGAEFVVTTGKYHGSAYIGEDVFQASRNNNGAYLDNKTAEIEGLYAEMIDSLDLYAWGNGGGKLGVVASIDTETATLTNPEDVRNFELNMVTVASNDDGSDSSHALLTGSSYVTAIDAAAGTVTFEDISDMSGIAQTDFLFRQGDFFGNTGTVVLKGLQYQVAGSASPGALYSVTRTAHPIGLGGCYIASADLSDLSIEERIQLLGNYMRGRFKSRASREGYLHPEDWHSLSISLQQRGQRPANDPNSKWGHQYLSVNTGGVEQKIYVAANCPKGTYFALPSEHWTLASMGELIYPIQQDGVTILRTASADTFEYRLKSHPALYTNAPRRSGRVSLT